MENKRDNINSFRELIQELDKQITIFLQKDDTILEKETLIDELMKIDKKKLRPPLGFGKIIPFEGELYSDQIIEQMESVYGAFNSSNTI